MTPGTQTGIRSFFSKAPVSVPACAVSFNTSTSSSQVLFSNSHTPVTSHGPLSEAYSSPSNTYVTSVSNQLTSLSIPTTNYISMSDTVPITRTDCGLRQSNLSVSVTSVCSSNTLTSVVSCHLPYIPPRSVVSDINNLSPPPLQPFFSFLPPPTIVPQTKEHSPSTTQPPTVTSAVPASSTPISSAAPRQAASVSSLPQTEPSHPVKRDKLESSMEESDNKMPNRGSSDFFHYLS